MDEEILTCDKNSYNLNSLFMFSFNFDVLKQLITELTLAKTRSDNNFIRITEVLKEKDNKIEK